MTQLRKKMIRELQLQRKAPATIHQYVHAVADLARYYGRRPDKISLEEVRSYLHYLLVERKLAANTCNLKVVALRFFYRRVLGQQDFELNVRCKRSGKLPEPLSREEVARLFGATNNLKHRLLLMTTYAAGLRSAEVVRLQPRHIHSERMLIRVEQGKGCKDRYTLLSQALLEQLRTYWQTYRPGEWLFPNATKTGPMSADNARRTYYRVKRRAGVKHGHGIHTLRHSFATHLLEAGVRLPVIQLLLGHNKITTTMRYLHVTEKHLSTVESPLDLLRLPRAVEDLGR
jgi:site-specific recombinase XerD